MEDYKYWLYCGTSRVCKVQHSDYCSRFNDQDKIFYSNLYYCYCKGCYKTLSTLCTEVT